MLGKGIVKSQIAKLIEVSLSFVISVLLTRRMGPDGFGSYSLILGWIGFVGLGISLGFSEILNKYLPRLISDSVQISSFFLPLLVIRMGLALIVSLVVALFAPSLFSWLKHGEMLPYVNYILVLLLLTQACNLFWSFYIARIDIGTVFLSHTLQQVIVIGAVFWLSGLENISLQSLLIVTCIAWVSGALVYALAYQGANTRKGKKWGANQFKPVLKFGLSAWAAAAITFLLSEQSDVLLLGYIVQGTRSVAYYKVGTALVWKLIGVITVGAQVVLTSLSTLYAREGEEGFSRGWRTFMKLSVLLVVPSYLLLGWYAPQIITLLYGPEYVFSALVLRLFVALTVIPFGLLGGGLHLMALYTVGREREGLIIRAISGVVNVILGVFLISLHGVVGAVIATGVATFLGISLEFLALQRFSPQQYPWDFSLKTVAAMFIGAALLFPVPARTWYELLGVGSAYGLVIGLALMWWKPLAAEDCEMLGRISPRLATIATWFSSAA